MHIRREIASGSSALEEIVYLTMEGVEVFIHIVIKEPIRSVYLVAF